MRTDRYRGQIVLPEISLEGQKKLGKSRVTIVGMGGTGSMAAEIFSRIGTGYLRLIDGDRVHESNLHRQILYDEGDLGSYKAVSAARRLKSENSEVEIDARTEFLDGENAERLLSGSDLIYDGTDNIASRRAINSASISLRIPWIMSSAIEYYGQVKAIIPGKTSCLACMNYPEEEAALSCSEQGIFPSVLLWVTSIGITEAVNIILNREVNGDFYHVDVKRLDMQRIRAERNASCSECSSIR